MRIVASPLEAIVSTKLEETISKIASIVTEKDAKVVLVGMPYLPNGNEGEQCARVRLFLRALQEQLPDSVQTEEIDERFSSHEARRLLKETGKKRKDLKEFVDSTAAVVILREFIAK
jgi:putative Holliday junction resolvase